MVIGLGRLFRAYFYMAVSVLIPMEERKYALPFGMNVGSEQQYLLGILKRQNRILLPLGFFLSFLTIICLYDAIVYPRYSNFLIAIFRDVRIWISIPGIIFLVALLKYRNIPYKLIRLYYPQRVLHFFELYPKMKDTSRLHDILYRIYYSAGLIQPEYDKDGTLKQPAKKHCQEINERIKVTQKERSKKKTIFDVSWKQAHIHDLLIIVIGLIMPAIICLIFINIIVSASLSEPIQNTLCNLSLIIWFILTIYIFIKIFDYGEMIHVKKFGEPLTVNHIKHFKQEVQKQCKKIIPGLSIVYTQHPVPADVLEYVQSREGLILGRHTITIIKETEIGYEVVWTG